LLFVVAANPVAEPIGPAADAFIERVEMRRDRVRDESKMRQVKSRRIQRADFLDRVLPRLDVQLRRNKGRNRRTPTQSHAGDVAAEQVIFPSESFGTLCHGRDVFDGKMMPDKATSGTI